MATTNNGRVDTLYGDNYNIYNLFQEEKRPSMNFNEEAIKGTHVANPLSIMFFSRQNIDALQEAIRYQVYVKSCKNHIIDRQSDTDLKVIMRATYLEHAEHMLPTASSQQVMEEVRRLNTIVIQFCVPRILQEINIYMKYKKDISSLPVPLDRGEFVSAKGTKTLITKEL